MGKAGFGAGKARGKGGRVVEGVILARVGNIGGAATSGQGHSSEAPGFLHGPVAALECTTDDSR